MPERSAMSLQNDEKLEALVKARLELFVSERDSTFADQFCDPAIPPPYGWIGDCRLRSRLLVSGERN